MPKPARRWRALRWSDGALFAGSAFIDRKSGATRAVLDARRRSRPPTAASCASRRRRRARSRIVSSKRASCRAAATASPCTTSSAPRRSCATCAGEWDDVEVMLDDSLSAVAGAATRSTSRLGAAVDGRRRARLVRTQRRRVRRRRRPRSRPKSWPRCCNRAAATPKCAASSSTSKLRSAAICSPKSPTASATAWPRSSRCTTKCTKSFGDVTLPEEVERLRDRLRDFSGIEEVEPPAALRITLRGYQRRGLDFLAVSELVSVRRHLGRRDGPGQDAASRHLSAQAQTRWKGRRRRWSSRRRR